MCVFNPTFIARPLQLLLRNIYRTIRVCHQLNKLAGRTHERANFKFLEKLHLKFFFIFITRQKVVIPSEMKNFFHRKVFLN